MFCKLCGALQEDKDYVFCGVVHAHLHYVFIEKGYIYMHAYERSIDDATKCKICDKTYIQHSSFATCETCNRKGTLKGVLDDKALCEKCFDLLDSEMRNSIVKNDNAIYNVLEEARAIDVSIVNSQDIFNAHTVAHIELKKAIDNDISIADADKDRFYIMRLIERYETFEAAINTQDDIIHEATKLKTGNQIAKLSIASELRRFNNLVREDIRNKLREADKQYSSPSATPKVKEISKKVKAAPQDHYTRMIQSIMINKNVTKEEAEKIFMSVTTQKNEQGKVVKPSA